MAGCQVGQGRLYLEDKYVYQYHTKNRDTEHKIEDRQTEERQEKKITTTTLMTMMIKTMATIHNNNYY